MRLKNLDYSHFRKAVLECNGRRESCSMSKQVA